MSEKLHKILHKNLPMDLENIAITANTDKRMQGNFYTPNYELFFEQIRYDNLKILELGIGPPKYGSLILWENYFPNADIYAVDILDECKKYKGRTKVIIGNLDDRTFLDSLIQQTGGEFDIIIDDAGHHVVQQKNLFNYLFKHVKDGGIYIVEDLGTSYLGQFGGGYRKADSMIEFLKSLVDSVNTPFFKRTPLFYKLAPFGPQPLPEEPTFEEDNIYAMSFFKGICFIFKGNRYI